MKAGEVWLHTIDLDPGVERVAMCRQRLAAGELERANRFRRDAERNRWIVGRAGLRTVLAEYCGTDPDALGFDTQDNNKPCLASPALKHPLHFNLTHSGTVALVAVTRVGPVGVDVERMRDLPDRDAIVARFFSPREQAAFRGVPERDRCRAFYRGWTRKEAVIKATGEGLSADLDGFDVSLAPGEAARMISLDGQRSAAKYWRLFHLQPRAGYVGALAMESKMPVRCIVV